MGLPFHRGTFNLGILHLPNLGSVFKKVYKFKIKTQENPRWPLKIKTGELADKIIFCKAKMPILVIILISCI